MDLDNTTTPGADDATATVTRRWALKGLAGAAAMAAVPFAALRASAQAAFSPFTTATGPSTGTVKALGATASAPGTPYLVPTAPGWNATSMLTAGNTVKGYTMVGIPDGLGVFDNGDRTVTVLMNHEIGAGLGVARGHGGKGAFVSRWVVNKDTLEVVSGRDFVATPADLKLWDAAAKTWVAGDKAQPKQLEMIRLCSADLAPISAYYNAATGKGYNGRIFLNGEEAGVDTDSRGFGWVLNDNTGYQLTGFAVGKANDTTNPPPGWENLVAHPNTGDATVVIATSDGGTNQVFVYVGAKQTDGNPVEKAGLTNGNIWSILVASVATEDRTANVGLTKSLAGKGAGMKISLAAPNKGTTFLRPEDGAWDPRNPNVFYFVTTDRANLAADGNAADGQDVNQIGRSRLWAVTFDNVAKIATDGSPAGKIELLLDGTEGGDMFDNIAIDGAGRIVLQEDPGNDRHNAKMWQYDTATGALTMIFKANPAMFGDVVNKTFTPATAPFNVDEEFSGVVDASAAFGNAAWFRPGSQVWLAVAQAHFDYDKTDPTGLALYQGGQLLMLTKTA